jgi:gamma-glutamyl hercynylcysteine S-oxide synthase
MLKKNLDSKLKDYPVKFKKDKILKLLIDLYEINIQLFKYLKDKDISGYESDLNIGILSESSGITLGQGTNPLLWELGHICYFFEYHCFKNIIKDYQFYITDSELYDSFITSRKYRFENKSYSKEFLFNYYEYIFKNCIKLLFDQNLNESNYYLFMLCILHNHMHCESFVFTKKLLGFKDTIYKSIIKYDKKIKFKFINIKGGLFSQGNIKGENLFAFDNEMPQFEKKIQDFSVSKYCVTEEIVKDFILIGGYKNKEYWSTNGWRWIQENNIDLPFYWIKKEDKLMINDHGEDRDISSTLPACHMSWFEAEAICKWMGGRLPSESEWEYLATNYGNSKYPWGNTIKKNIGNLNYSGNICPVNNYSEGDNKNEVRQLFGNVWEWCQEAIYPYDGFKIDPVYKEFSYPFFGFKKILRGGSWATPDILINSRYRNAQMPDCRIQFTGIRVVKSI